MTRTAFDPETFVTDPRSPDFMKGASVEHRLKVLRETFTAIGGAR